MDDESSSSLFLTICTTSAIALGATVSLLQIDPISRCILSPQTLRSRRRQEVFYEFEQFLFHTLWKQNRTKICDLEEYHYHEEQERAFTDLLTRDEDVKKVVKDILGNKKERSCEAPKPFILALEQDSEDMEWYLHLAFAPTSPKQRRWRRIQLPLVKFCEILGKEFEGMITSTALCFISDASSNFGRDCLYRVLKGCDDGLGIVREPLWMLAVAYLAEKHILSNKHLETVLYALCRLDAWCLRDDLGNNRTVVFFIPGQSTIPTLLPKLQNAFPCERHVFVYDSSLNSLSRALLPPKENDMIPYKITACSPISQLKSINTEKYNAGMQTLPSQHAKIVECWMSAVDTFIAMKLESEKSNEYLPFVLRCGFLKSKDEEEKYMALTNVLQYITGTRSRPLKEEILVKAKLALDQFLLNSSSSTKVVTEQQRIDMEACVFMHKMILIGDKTLMDTVQPAKEWSLKAAKKLTSCACCAPEEEDEEEGEEQEEEEGAEREKGDVVMMDLSVPGAGFATNMNTNGLRKRGGGDGAKSRPVYVDGKAGFAFDPTKF